MTDLLTFGTYAIQAAGIPVGIWAAWAVLTRPW